MAVPLKRRVPGKEVSRETLLLTSGKAYQFLMGVNQLTTVREDLAERGMTEAERDFNRTGLPPVKPRFFDPSRARSFGQTHEPTEPEPKQRYSY